jgi:hypothetical protein
MANNRLIIVNDDNKIYKVIWSHNSSLWSVDEKGLKDFLEKIWEWWDETSFRFTTEMSEENIYSNKEYKQVYDIEKIYY